MSHFILPEGCTLTITGPMAVTLVPQSTPVAVPPQAPMATPMMVPQATPQAVPQATPHPVVNAAGFAPTYASWGGYAPVPQATPPAVWSAYHPAVAFGAYHEVQQGYGPTYPHPTPAPEALMLAPMKIPQPMPQSVPGLAPDADPAVEAMAGYLEAREYAAKKDQFREQAKETLETVKDMPQDPAKMDEMLKKAVSE